MISLPEITICDVAGELGEYVLSNADFPRVASTTGFSARCQAAHETSLLDLALRAARKVNCAEIGAVIAATFSSAERFPALAIRVASALGLPADAPAFDLQMACSAYPYAIYVAGRLAADLRQKVLVIHGDIQSRLTDSTDLATAPLFSDAATATIVKCAENGANRSLFLTYSRASEALICPADGPIRMDGFGVFSFVAEQVVDLLRPFEGQYDYFVPHQANLYMVRRLARELGLSDEKVVMSDGRWANPGGCSIPLLLAEAHRNGTALLAGFGAGLSAAALTVRVDLSQD